MIKFCITMDALGTCIRGLLHRARARPPLPCCGASPEGGDFVGTQEEAEGQVRVVYHDNGYYREEARRERHELEDYREERR
jgi:hypothetical protein